MAKRKRVSEVATAPEPVLVPIIEAIGKFRVDFANAIGKRFQPYENTVAKFREEAATNITYAMMWHGHSAMEAELVFRTVEYREWKKHGENLLAEWSDPAARKNIRLNADLLLDDILNGNHDHGRSTNPIANMESELRLAVKQEQLRILTFALKALKVWDTLNTLKNSGQTRVAESLCRPPSWYELYYGLEIGE